MKNLKKLSALLIALSLVLSMLACASFAVSAKTLTANCAVAATEQNVGTDDYYVSADVTFSSSDEFTAGIFTAEAANFTLTDCTVKSCVGGEAPEVYAEGTTGKVVFAGFSESNVNDFRAYTSLTLNLKFKLSGEDTGAERRVAVKNITLVNIDEEKFVTANAECVAEAPHIHTPGDEWQKDAANHWKVCAACGEAVDTAAHTFDTVVTPPSCTAGGYTTYTCTVCGYSYTGDETEPTLHTLGDWLSDENEHWHACTGCAAIVDKAAHTFDTVVTPPSCTEGGYTTHTCTVCGYSYTSDETSPLNHTTGDWISDENEHWHACTACTAIVDKAAHAFDTVVTPPSCTEGGYTTHTCTVCGYSYTSDETAPLNHTTGDWLSDENEHWHACTACTAILDKAAHTESDWIIDKEASAEEKGHRHKECIVCGRILAEEDIEKLSTHTPGDINDDGEVNNKDLTRLFQYLSEWDVTVNEAALDVNGDGDVNNKDLTRLFQYLSEWDVVIF